MAGITVTRRNGNLLACKSARPEKSERIRHEAQLLERLQHPGIVQFVEFVEGPEVELYLGFVGPDSWATQPPATSAESIEALASAAATVADLHRLGTVHGALCPEHVLVAPDKRPVLCGMADATTSTETGRAGDLAGFASLIDHLAAACEEKERRQLDALARRAERGSVTADDVTAELDRLHGGPRKRSTRRSLPTISRPSRRASAAAAAVLAVAVLGWSILKPGGSGSGTPQLSTLPSDSELADAGPTGAGQDNTGPVGAGPSDSGTTGAGTTGAGTTGAGTTGAGTTGAGTTGAGTTGAGTTGEGTTGAGPANLASITDADAVSSGGNQIRVDDGGRVIIDHRGRRYGVGQPGDKAVVGDWNCDGNPTLALLQPSTGVIAVFAGWPAPSQRLEAGYVTVVDGATDIRNDPSGGCDQLRVTHAGGSTLIETEFP